MVSAPKWQYNEMKFCGVDFSRADEVAAYDRMHKKFRDYGKATDEIIRRLSLGPDSTVIDLGSGTGAFTLHAAKKCRTIYAVDISAAMIEYCRQQATRDGLTNIVFCHGGLLTYEHVAELADAAVCVAVLHHLPDFWKLAALTRCCAMLKPGGRFLLFDIVFPSGEANLQQKIDEWVGAVEAMADARLAQEAISHPPEENVLGFCAANRIPVFEYRIKTLRELESMRVATRLDPSRSTLCTRPKCDKCGKHLVQRTLFVVSGKCWKCGAGMQIAFMRREGRMLTPEEMTEGEVGEAEKRGACLRKSASAIRGTIYLANTCKGCGAFTGSYYLHNFWNLMDETEGLVTGMSCSMDCSTITEGP